MNLTDLREVLDERSDTERAGARAQLVLGGVHHRIRVRARRRRAAAVAAATLAVLAVGVGTLSVSRPADRPPTVAAAPMRMIEGFPEYADGTRLVAAKSAQPPARSVSVTFIVPRALAVSFSYRCQDANTEADTEADTHTLTLNGKQVAHGQDCGGSLLADPGTLAQTYGVRAGAPATATLTMLDQPTAEFALAVGVQVDLAEYRFPPRPASLPPLEVPTGSDKQVLRADPADPQQTRRLTFRWTAPRQISLFANTPGALTVQLNGSKVFSGQWWDYRMAGTGSDLPAIAEGLGLRAGQQVTMTVTPERMTGDWAVVLER